MTLHNWPGTCLYCVCVSVCLCARVCYDDVTVFSKLKASLAVSPQTRVQMRCSLPISSSMTHMVRQMRVCCVCECVSAYVCDHGWLLAHAGCCQSPHPYLLWTSAAISGGRVGFQAHWTPPPPRTLCVSACASVCVCVCARVRVCDTRLRYACGRRDPVWMLQPPPWHLGGLNGFQQL